MRDRSGVETTRSARPTDELTINAESRDVIIKGPRGFCVDKDASQTDTDPAFVLLGNCAALGRGFNLRQPEVRALLTASVSNGGSEGMVANTMPALDQFFRSDDGKAALSRSSDPETVQILDTFAQEDSYFLHAEDTSPAIVPGAANGYWRSYFDVGDQIVAVSVIATTEQPLSPEQSLNLVKSFANEIRAANGLAVTPVDEVLTASAQVETAPTSRYETDAVAGNDPDYVEYDVNSQQPQRQQRRNNALRTLQTIGLLRRLLM